MAINLSQIGQSLAAEQQRRQAQPTMATPPGPGVPMDPNGLVPVNRGMAPATAAPPAMPPALPSAGIVPVNRPMPSINANQQAQLVVARNRALQFLRANRGHPEVLARVAKLGGAVMGRAHAAQQALPPPADPMARQQALSQVVSDKALPYLNNRPTGLLGY